MRAALVVAAASALVLGVDASSTWASCGPHPTSIATQTGSLLPTRGVLYTRGPDTLEVESLGAASWRTVVHHPRPHTLDAIVRHDYVAWPGALRVEVDGDAFSYEVSAGWQAPVEAPRVVSLVRVERDGCPGYHGLSSRTPRRATWAAARPCSSAMPRAAASRSR